MKYIVKNKETNKVIMKYEDESNIIMNCYQIKESINDYLSVINDNELIWNLIKIYYV